MTQTTAIDIERERWKAAYNDLARTVCRCCGGGKQAKMSFNGFCYHALPTRLKRGLWDREHYVENYFAALAWLLVRFKQKQLAPLTAGVIQKGAFDRFYVEHPHDPSLAWSGSQWVRHLRGLPEHGIVQVCNFASETEARDYIRANSARTRPATEGFNSELLRRSDLDRAFEVKRD